MKGQGPTDSLRKIPDLTPQLNRFIDGMGMYFEDQGIPRIGGRILGLLMIAHWPLSAEDIASILGISRASVSTNFRLLLSTGMVEKVTLRGNRTTFYVFSDSAMEQRTTVLIQTMLEFKKLLGQALEALPPKDPSRHHLDDSLVWSDLLIESFNHAQTDWRGRHHAHAHHSMAEGART
jgi:DNA-binding transcriptional regulator GbsR (MarR family)